MINSLKFREAIRAALVAPSAAIIQYFYENFGDHGYNESVYRHLFTRSISAVGIEDKYVPIEGAASYSLLYILFATVAALKPTAVLELGCGQSTILLNEMRQRGIWTGQLTSLEEDRGWSEIISDRSGHSVLHAPLVRQQIAGRTALGYHLESMCEIADPYELLLIDGPQGAPRWSRLAALAFTDKLMTERFVVIMDDFNRFGEQQTMRLLEIQLRRSHGEFSAMTIRSNKHQRLLMKGLEVGAVFV